MGDGFLANMSPDTQGLLKLMGGIMPRVALGANAPQQIASGGGFRPGGILSAIAEYASGKQQRQAQQQMGQLTQRAYGPIEERFKGTEGLDLSRAYQLPDFAKNIPELLKRVTPQPQIPASTRLGITPEQAELRRQGLPLPPGVEPRMTEKQLAKTMYAESFTPMETQYANVIAGPLGVSEKLIEQEKKGRELATQKATEQYFTQRYGAGMGRLNPEARTIVESERQFDMLAASMNSIMNSRAMDDYTVAHYNAAVNSRSLSALQGVQSAFQEKIKMKGEYEKAAAIANMAVEGKITLGAAGVRIAEMGVNPDWFFKPYEYMLKQENLKLYRDDIALKTQEGIALQKDKAEVQKQTIKDKNERAERALALDNIRTNEMSMRNLEEPTYELGMKVKAEEAQGIKNGPARQAYNQSLDLRRSLQEDNVDLRYGAPEKHPHAQDFLAELNKFFAANSGLNPEQMPTAVLDKLRRLDPFIMSQRTALALLRLYIQSRQAQPPPAELPKPYPIH